MSFVCVLPLSGQVFYNMETADSAVSTRDLTESFGWTEADSFQQHDLQELLRVLTDHLEEKMKGTVLQRSIGQLLQGKITTTTKCVNVDFTSSRSEDFFDVQLTVKGCDTLQDSFQKCVQACATVCVCERD
jgi:ubiquitin carboxyl-terminal hydrolase 7